MTEFLIQNWELIVSILVVVIGGGYIIFTAANQKGKIKEWLMWACEYVEDAFGEKAGSFKLRTVYDMFIAKFPVISKIVSFETFQEWTEIALAKVKETLSAENTEDEENAEEQ